MRSWSFITLQIQLAAEQIEKDCLPCPAETRLPQNPLLPEEPDSAWAKANAQISRQISEIAFGVPDEPTKLWLESEYEAVINEALLDLGIEEIRFVVCGPLSNPLELDRASCDLEKS
jgi:hypothetical protein